MLSISMKYKHMYSNHYFGFMSNYVQIHLLSDVVNTVVFRLCHIQVILVSTHSYDKQKIFSFIHKRLKS